MTAGDAHHDVVVIGGGLVGAAIAHGLAGRVERLALLDEGDVALRASRGNFGLVWVQSKGSGNPAYGAWTLASASAWPDLAQRPRTTPTGIDVRLEQPGGISVMLSDDEVDAARRVDAAACSRSPACRRTTGSCSTRRRCASACRASAPRCGPGCTAATTAT